MHREAAAPAAQSGLFGDFRLLVGLFIALRLTLAMVYQPYVLERYDADGALAPVERGLSMFGDYQYFFQFAQLSDEGLLPYRDYWYEFPPVWSTLFIGAYQLLAARGTVERDSKSLRGMPTAAPPTRPVPAGQPAGAGRRAERHGRAGAAADRPAGA